MTILRLSWFVAMVLTFLAFIFYSFAIPQLFGDRTQEAWQWLLPNILPPIGALFGINLAQNYAATKESGNGKEDEGKANQTAPASYVSVPYAIAFSWFFIVALLISVFGVMFSPSPLDFLNTSSLWLAPLLAVAMGMVVACVPLQAPGGKQPD